MNSLQQPHEVRLRGLPAAAHSDANVRASGFASRDQTDIRPSPLEGEGVVLTAQPFAPYRGGVGPRPSRFCRLSPVPCSLSPLP